MKSCAVLLLAALVLRFTDAQNGPSVDVPVLGTILGKEIKTKGNLGKEPKTYFAFRNIPYAESVAGEARFSVSRVCFIKHTQLFHDILATFHQI